VSGPPLLDMGRRYRLVLIASPVVGLIGLVVLIVLGYPIAGAALCVGLAMGFVNSRMVIAQAAKFMGTENASKRAFTVGALQRLAVLTVVAMLIAYSFKPQGFAVFIGLAVFQLLLMGTTTSAMLRELRG